MGVLDDAIREHLELKKRHGASEEEIARKEAEALGPARRGPAPDADAGDAVEPAAGPVAAEAPDPVDGAPAAGHPPDVEPEPEPLAPLAETEPVPDGEEPAPAAVEPTIDVPAEAEPPAAIDAAPAGPVEADLPPVHDVDRDPLEPPAPAPAPEPGATAEFDTLSARHDEEPADEDVLEETPEFLRESPEEDRLWFEQKPPRDFDLDN